MKTPAIPLKDDTRTKKFALKKLRTLDRRFQQRFQETKRLKIVQSMSAGRVRGGHAFH